VCVHHIKAEQDYILNGMLAIKGPFLASLAGSLLHPQDKWPGCAAWVKGLTGLKASV